MPWCEIRCIVSSVPAHVMGRANSSQAMWVNPFVGAMPWTGAHILKGDKQRNTEVHTLQA